MTLPASDDRLTAAINRLAAALERQNAGHCPVIFEVKLLDGTSIEACRYPAGHTGLHANDEEVSGGRNVWSTNAEGARTLEDPTCGATRDATEWADRGSDRAFGPATDWPCVLAPKHPRRHQDRDGDKWWS